MQEIINIIINKHKKLFGNNPIITKINVGFTNTIYNINDLYILKICSNHSNEKNFQKEIEFYNKNRENTLIPKLYFHDTSKKDIPYYYEIIEKINGVSLYNVWHTFKETKRKEIIKQICFAMKQFHSKIGPSYDWTEYLKRQFYPLYLKSKTLNIFNTQEQNLIDASYQKFDQYLKSEEFVLVHNDLHFDNIFYNEGQIKLIDFERSMYAPKDFELDIFFRMIRKPWKFASEETEKYTNPEDYKNILLYVEKYYPKILSTPFLTERLAIYDMVYFLEHLINYSDDKELKQDVINASLIIASKDNTNKL